MNRLDPSCKCLCFDGFDVKNPHSRTENLEAMLKEHFGSPNVISIEHVWQDPPDDRSVGNKSLVEFSSRGMREGMLKKFSRADFEEDLPVLD